MSKQTSDDVSKVASRVMKKWKREKKEFASRKSDLANVTWSDVLALAGSCMVQDEQKGKRK